MTLLPGQEITIRPKAGQEVLVIAPAGQTVSVTFDRARSRSRTKISGTYVQPAPSPEPEPEPPPPPSTGTLWISDAEIMALPTNNTAFARIKKIADGSAPSLSSSYSEAHAHWVMACALVGKRTSSSVYSDKVKAALQKVVATPYGKDSNKEVTRNLPEYVMSASILGLRDQAFIDWLKRVVAYTWGGSDAGTMASNNEEGPGNSAACNGASITAAGIYLKDDAMIASGVKGIKMFCGLTPGQFDYREDRDLWYSPKDAQAQPINPAGARLTISGLSRNVEGFSGCEMERTSPAPLVWPPKHTADYVRLTIGVRVLQAELLVKAGHLPDAFDLGNKCLLRAAQAEIRLATEETSDASWADRTYYHYALLERRTGASLGAKPGTKGRCVNGVDWTHPSEDEGLTREQE